MHWRFLDSPVLRGAVNMAYDQALFEGVQDGGAPVLRFYRWAPACLSLGRNQVVVRREAVARATAARGFDLVRRVTGGAAVLHDRELTYSVAVPVGLLGSPRETYLAINRALVAGLRGLGVAAEVAGEGRARKAHAADRRAGREAGAGGQEGAAAGAPPLVAWDDPCFQAPAPGEVVAGGLKLVGSAQRCERRTLIQHGSILLAGDQGVVAECLAGEPIGARAGTTSATAGFTTLAALLDPLPTHAELVAAFVAGFETELGLELRPDGLTRAEEARIERLVARFESPAWTWRR